MSGRGGGICAFAGTFTWARTLRGMVAPASIEEVPVDEQGDGELQFSGGFCTFNGDGVRTYRGIRGVSTLSEPHVSVSDKNGSSAGQSIDPSIMSVMLLMRLPTEEVLSDDSDKKDVSVNGDSRLDQLLS